MQKHDDRPAGPSAVAEAKTGFAATRAGSLVLLTPLTPTASAWLQEHVDEEASWLGDSLAVELRYVPPLVAGIVAAGFTFACED